MSKKPAKKFIIVALILALLVPLALFFGACGEEEEDTVYDYFSFSPALGGLVVSVKSGKINDLPNNVTIPASYYADGGSQGNKTAVVAIADSAFADCTKITSVTLPDTLKSIGKGAFSGCNALTDINLDDVDEIGKDAFKNCKKLTAVNFSSDKFTAIPEGAFSGCLALRTVGGDSKIKTIGTDAFRACAALMTIDADLLALASIGSGAFFFTGCLTTFEIPSSCKTVQSFAFQGWTEYQTVYYTSASGWDNDWNAGAPQSVFMKR